MAETRKIVAILAAAVVGFSRMANADEDGTLAQLRRLRDEVIDPAVAGQNGRVFKRTGDGALVEFRSVVEAVRCALSIQNAMAGRNVGMRPDERIDFRVGIHLGDVVEESDGDVMGDGVNIAARLEGIAAPGAICLSEDAYRQVKGRLDVAVTDLGPTRLKNIAEPVRAYALHVGRPAKVRPSRALRASPAVFAAAFVAIAAGAWYVWARNPAAAPPAHLSIVVLPFANLSGDATQDYFADGVTENLTTDLSRIRDSFVIAHNTAFTYKGRNIDAREIGRELNVRYVLEGSVQRDSGRVRVNAQLIDAQTGAHLWADRFEEDIGDLFKLQDEVVARLANSLGYALVKAEADIGARSTKPDAMDLDMRGRAVIAQTVQGPRSRESVGTECALFERALEIDPDDADALAGKAETYMAEYALGWKDPQVDYDAAILAAADRSILLQNNIMGAYYAKTLYLVLTKRSAEAIRAADAGIAVDPNSAALWAARGLAESQQRQFGQAKSDIAQAVRLSPRDW